MHWLTQLLSACTPHAPAWLCIVGSWVALLAASYIVTLAWLYRRAQ
jgi:hypothetical protein